VLNGNPQVRGTVLRVRIATPKKPNSARRPVAKIILINKNNVVAHLPGIGHNLRKHSAVLVCGVGARDLPGVRHSCIRGVKDFGPVASRTKRRSVYGIKNSLKQDRKLRRKLRQL
jgi:small subunit ribosomal protein S12